MSADESHSIKDIHYHDAIAAEYDAVVVEPRKVSIDALFRPLQHVLPRSKRAMLDIGCGTGHMLCRYGPRFEKVIAIDHSRGMLDIAERNARAHGVRNIELIRGDAIEFLRSHAGSKFDLITCVGFLHHLEAAQIHEIFRLARGLLAPEGIFVFCEPIETLAQEPAAIGRWNTRYRTSPRTYSVEAEDPDEAPLRLEFLRAAVEDAGLAILKEERGWEIFQPTARPRLVDKIAIPLLHALFKADDGAVYLACCKARP